MCIRDSTCSIQFDNCTSCDINSPTSNFYLLNNSCIENCPTFYYTDNLTASCILCSTLTSRNCDDCASNRQCNSCNGDYVLFNNSCVATTPVGYVNISGVAQPCTGDCATCSVFQYNCTACQTLNLNENECVANCPSG